MAHQTLWDTLYVQADAHFDNGASSGLHDFRVSPRPIGTNWGFALGWKYIDKALGIRTIEQVSKLGFCFRAAVRSDLNI